MKRLSTLFLSVFVTACTMGGGGSGNFSAYYPEARNILTEHAKVSAKFADMNNNELGSQAAVDEIEKVVLPALQNLGRDASQINMSDADLDSMHKQLLEGLHKKYEGYKAMVAAYRKVDLSAFTEAKDTVFKGADAITKFEDRLERMRVEGGY